ADRLHAAAGRRGITREAGGDARGQNHRAGIRMSLDTATSVLEVRGLRRAFGGLVAVNDLGFAVGPGEIMGLLGPNGSGKTTALNVMSGVLRPDAGTIRLMDRDIAGLASYRIARLRPARTFPLVRVLDGVGWRAITQGRPE